MAQATGYLSSRCHQKVTVTQKTMHLAHSGRVNFPKDKLEKSTSFLPHVIKLNVIQSHGNEYTNMLEQIHYDTLLPFLRLWRTFCSHFFPRDILITAVRSWPLLPRTAFLCDFLFLKSCSLQHTLPQDHQWLIYVWGTLLYHQTRKNQHL